MLNATAEFNLLAHALIDQPTPASAPVAVSSDVSVLSEGVTLVSRSGDDLEIRTGDQLSTAQSATPFVAPIVTLGNGTLEIIGSPIIDDLLIIDIDQFIDSDPSGMNFRGTIEFAGGNTGVDQDRLVLLDSNPSTDDSFQQLSYKFFIGTREVGGITATSADSPSALQVRFSDVEFIDQLAGTDNLDIAASFRPDRFTIENGASPGLNQIATVIDDQDGPLITITNPRESFSIHSLENDDEVIFHSVDDGFRAAIDIDGQDGNDQIVIAADLMLGSGNVVGDADLRADSIAIPGSIDTTAGNPDGTLTFAAGSTVHVSGNIDTGTSDLVVTDDARLEGGGNIAANVVVDNGGTLGTITVRSVELRNDGRIDARINGPTAVADYDQVVINPNDGVDGAVAIDGALLDLSFGFAMQASSEFILIDNDGSDAVGGRFRTFLGTDGVLLPVARVLEEGDVVLDTSSGIVEPAYITYSGGDGNDVAIATGGDLTIQSQGVTVISRHNLNLEIRVGDTLATALAASPIVRPIAGFNGRELNVMGTQAGDDILYIDFDEFVDPDPQAINFAGTIGFAGGNSGSDQDRLVFFDSNPATDDAFDTLDYQFSVAAREAGVIVADSPAAPSSLPIRFSDVERIDQFIETGELALTGSHRPDQFLISNAALAGHNTITTVINDLAGPLLTVSNPAELFSIDGGQSTDRFVIDSVDNGFAAAITLDGQAGEDTIAINAALSLGRVGLIGNVDLQAEVILIPGSIDTTGGSADGAVTFAAGSVVQLTGHINAGSNDVIVADRSRLEGDGQIESHVVIETSGIIAPGLTVGAITDDTASLTVGALDLATGSRMEVQLNGPNAGVNYDQIIIDPNDRVDGTVVIGDALLDYTLGFTPGENTEFVLIENDGVDTISGRLQTFIDVDGQTLVMPRTLAEGDVVFASTIGAAPAGRITYFGGDGNDVAIVTGGDVTIESQGVTLVSRRGANLEIRVGATFADAQAARPTVRPIAGFRGSQLRIQGTAPIDDQLFIDVDRFVDPQSINFEGTIVFAGDDGSSDADRLVVFDSDRSSDDSADAVSFASLAIPGSGLMDIDPQGGFPEIAIRYSGSEFVDQLIDAKQIDVTMSVRGETLVIDRDPGLPNQNQIQTLFDTTPGTFITIPNPGEKLSLFGGTGNDNVQFNGLSSSFAAALDVIAQDGFDTVTIATPLSLGQGAVTGDVQLSADSIRIDESITTTGGTSDGSITIIGGSEIAMGAATLSSGSSAILIDGNDGTIDTGDGTLQSLDSVVVRDASGVRLGGIVTPGGTFTLGVDRDISGPVTQGSGTSIIAGRLTASTNGPIDLSEPSNQFQVLDGIDSNGAIAISDGGGDLRVIGIDSGGNDITISTTGTAVLETVIESPGATVQINAGQAIRDFDPADTTAKLIADTVILNAGSPGIGQTGALEVDANVLSVDTSAGNGSVHITNPFGGLNIDQINAGSGVVRLFADQIDDAANDTLADFTASRLILQANTGIGALRPLELLAVQRLSAVTGSGGVSLDWTTTGDTVVEQLIAASGGILLTQRGAQNMDVQILENQSGPVSILSQDGSIDIAAGPLISADTIRMEAARDLSIDRSVRTTGGGITLQSGQSLRLLGRVDSTAVGTAGVISVSSPMLTFNQAQITSEGASITIDGDLTIDGETRVDSGNAQAATRGGNIEFTQTIGGADSVADLLVIDARGSSVSGDVTIGGPVGATGGVLAARDLNGLSINGNLVTINSVGVTGGDIHLSSSEVRLTGNELRTSISGDVDIDASLTVPSDDTTITAADAALLCAEVTGVASTGVVVITAGDEVLIEGAVSSLAGLIVGAVGTTRLNGSVEVNGDITLRGQVIELFSPSMVTPGEIIFANDVVFQADSQVDAGQLRFDGSVSVEPLLTVEITASLTDSPIAADLIKLGGGTLVLTGASPLTQNTRVSAGTLRLFGSFGSAASNVVIADGRNWKATR